MEEKKEIRTLEDLLKVLECVVDIPDNHRLVAVFEDNESEEIEGFLCVENGVEGDYPLLSLEDLLEEYGERDCKEIDDFREKHCRMGCGTQRCTGDGVWLSGCRMFRKFFGLENI